VGLRATAQANLVGAMWKVAHGELPEIDFSIRPIEFDANGSVSFMP
jgi:hypothetical protein